MRTLIASALVLLACAPVPAADTACLSPVQAVQEAADIGLLAPITWYESPISVHLRPRFTVGVRFLDENGVEACVFEHGVPIEIRVAITNEADYPQTILHHTQQVWDVYLFEAGTLDLVHRRSWFAFDGDDLIRVDIAPSETWFDPIHPFLVPRDDTRMLLPPGRYDGYVHVEASDESPPDFTRPDGRLSKRFTIELVDPGEYTPRDATGRALRDLHEGRASRDRVLPRPVRLDLRERSGP